MLKKIIYSCLIFSLMTYNVLVVAKSLNSEEDRLSYSMGYMAGLSIKAEIEKGMPINLDIFSRGLGDSIKNTPQIPEEEMLKSLNYLKKKTMEHNTKNLNSKADTNLKLAKEFLAKNKQNKNIVELPNGLQYQIIESGDQSANSPQKSDKVKVAYRGMLLDGTEFDSSYGRGEPAVFELSHLIKGWQSALCLMKPKAKWKIFVPPALAYGSAGAGSMIEPNSALIFDIELLAVNP